MPRTMDAIAITHETPITTPRIVSAERILAPRRASNASATFSPKSVKKRKSLRRLFTAIMIDNALPEPLSGVCPRRLFPGRHRADARASGERHRSRRGVLLRRPAKLVRDQERGTAVVRGVTDCSAALPPRGQPEGRDRLWTILSRLLRELRHHGALRD